ncbi:hypothetical protein FQA39_LY06578 [Lamprigera yunnana]|nr:hypothetical protein FQA39_LY06578 [Lamprigera yunnana]
MANLIRKLISTAKAPKPIAFYNQAVVWNNTLYVSGVLGMNKDTNKLVPGGIAAETRQALINLGHILEAADSGYEKVVKTTILLQDIKDFGTVNDIYKEYKNCQVISKGAGDTAELLFFFYRLFDSVNGSCGLPKKGKILRSGITDSTAHLTFWKNEAIPLLTSMEFDVNNNKDKKKPPSLTNWIFSEK